MAAAYVAAGSNVRPRANLRRAIARLGELFPGLRHSRAWSNPAIGFTGDDFINLVIAFPATLPPEELLDCLKAIERAAGRGAGAPKWGPRTLDLDLLLYGDHCGRFAGAVLPHPDLLRRAFVLGPLAEIAPAVRHPVLGTTVAELWNRFDQRAHPLTEVSLEDADP